MAGKNFYKQRRTPPHVKKNVLAQASLSLLIVALLFANCYAIVKMMNGQSVLPSGLSSLIPMQASDVQKAAPPPSEQAMNAKEEPWNSPERQEGTVNAGVPVAAVSAMLSLPENGKLSMEYFRDALFIGDSVTEGFAIYEPLKSVARIFGIRNATPKTYLDNAAVIDYGHGKLAIPAIWDAISAENPGKIYIMLGTNSIVSDPSDDAFLHWYAAVLDRLVQTFPGVPIYVQGITPVSQECAASNTNYSLSRLHTLNNKIAQMAVSKGLYYIDTHEALANDEGYLPPEIVGYGGMHILASGYTTWVDYLRTHTAYHPANLQFVEEGPYT